MYIAYIDICLLVKSTPYFSKTGTFTLKKDPFFKNQGPVKYAQKHPYFRVFLNADAYHKAWRVGGPGGGHITSQEKSLISGSSLLLLKHG